MMDDEAESELFRKVMYIHTHTPYRREALIILEAIICTVLIQCTLFDKKTYRV